MHLCSIRKTRYCSLGRSISSCCRAPGMQAVKYAVGKTWKTAPCSAISSQTGTGEIQEIGWSKTYRRAARTRGPSKSWPTTSCRKEHKRGVCSSVQWGQAKAGGACRRNESSVSGGEQRQPLYVEVSNSYPGGADLSEQWPSSRSAGAMGFSLLSGATCVFTFSSAEQGGWRGVLQAIWAMKVSVSHSTRKHEGAH